MLQELRTVYARRNIACSPQWRCSANPTARPCLTLASRARLH